MGFWIFYGRFDLVVVGAMLDVYLFSVHGCGRRHLPKRSWPFGVPRRCLL